MIPKSIAVFAAVLGIAAVVWFSSQPENSVKNYHVNDNNSGASTWKYLGGLIDGDKISFVEISIDHSKKIITYNSAVMAICAGKNICSVAFFLPGDAVPKSQTAREFYGSGGWSSFPVIALWRGNKNTNSLEFVKWDCKRAGAEDAPATALCGPADEDAYSAILALGSRVGLADHCKWGKSDDENLVKRYIEKIAKDETRKLFQSGFDMMKSSGARGPNDGSGCPSLKGKIDDAARAARKTLDM